MVYVDVFVHASACSGMFYMSGGKNQGTRWVHEFAMVQCKLAQHDVWIESKYFCSLTNTLGNLN